MAYDPAKDMVYIMGGISAREQFTWDLLTYTFGKLFCRWGGVVSSAKLHLEQNIQVQN